MLAWNAPPRPGCACSEPLPKQALQTLDAAARAEVAEKLSGVNALRDERGATKTPQPPRGAAATAPETRGAAAAADAPRGAALKDMGGAKTETRAYGFETRPRPAKGQGGPPAPPEEEFMGLTLMSDPRVVRGSTYSLYRDEPPAAGGGLDATRQKRRRRRKKEKSIFDRSDDKPATSAPLDLAPYLEEQARPTRVEDVDAQTDGFLEQPPPAPFVPPRTGVDGSTSMEDDQPFDFDVEVGPLLNVIVSKTLAQATLEVEQEAELEAIADDNSAKRRAQAEEKARVKAMEVAEVQREQTKAAELREAALRLGRERSLAAKVAASRCVAQVLPGIFERAYEHFEARGAWVPPVDYEVKAEVLPWLYEQVDAELQGRDLGDALLDDLLRACVEQCKAREKPPPPPEPDAEGPAPAPAADVEPAGEPPAEDEPAPAVDEGGEEDAAAA